MNNIIKKFTMALVLFFGVVTQVYGSSKIDYGFDINDNPPSVGKSASNTRHPFSARNLVIGSFVVFASMGRANGFNPHSSRSPFSKRGHALLLCAPQNSRNDANFFEHQKAIGFNILPVKDSAKLYPYINTTEHNLELARNFSSVLLKDPQVRELVKTFAINVLQDLWPSISKQLPRIPLVQTVIGSFFKAVQTTIVDYVSDISAVEDVATDATFELLNSKIIPDESIRLIIDFIEEKSVPKKNSNSTESITIERSLETDSDKVV